MPATLPLPRPVRAAAGAPPEHAASTDDLLHALREALDQGEALLRGLTDDHYTTPVPVAFNATIGGHYRHSLDHFRTLLDAVGAGAGALDYDRRERGTRIETDRLAALAATQALRAGCAAWPAGTLARPIAVTCKTCYATAGSQQAGSTLGREVMYAVAHAVHHYALIRIMAGLLGVNLPADFGVAPSTLRHRAVERANDGAAVAA